MNGPKSLHDRVTGENFSQNELSGEELAKLRHYLHILGQEHMAPQDFLKATSLAWLSNVSKSLPGYATLTAIYAILAAVVAFVAKYAGFVLP